MTDHPQADVEQTYQEANASYHAGSFDDAIDGFRSVLSHGPHPKASVKLAGLLHHRGLRLHDDGDPEGALAAYREAFALSPDLPKLATRFGQSLLESASAATTAGDLETARALLEEATGINPESARVGERLESLLSRVVAAQAHEVLMNTDPGELEAVLLESTSSLGERGEVIRDRVRRLPTGHYVDDVGGPVNDTKDVVFIEVGIDSALVGSYLDYFAGADIFSEVRFDGGSRHSDRATALTDQGTAGLAWEADLCLTTDTLADRVRAAVAANLPPRLRTTAGIDLLDMLSFQFDDVLFSAGRKIALLLEVLGSGRYGRVFFVLGTGQFGTVASVAAAQRLGSDSVYHLWCSRSLDRFDSRPRPGQVPDEGLRDRSSFLPSRASAKRRGLPSSPEDLSGGVALFISTGQVHIDNTLPIVRQLDADHPARILVPPRRPGGGERYRQLAASGPTGSGVVELGAGPAAGSITRLDRFRLTRAIVRIERAAARVDLRLEGFDLWPLVRTQILKMAGEGIHRLSRFVTAFSGYLRSHRPSVLVISPDRSPEARAACLLARREDVPSVVPQCVLISPSPRLKDLQADYATVLDDFTAQLYEQHFGASPGQVEVTGIPRFDRAIDLVRASAGRGSDGAGTDAERIVTLALQRFSPEDTERLITTVSSALEGRSDVRLVVKMHPGDDPSNLPRYEAVLNRAWSGTHEVRQGGDIYELLARSHVVVGVFSNVVLEAAIIGRVAVCVNLTDDELPVPFVEQGIAIGVGNTSELRETLTKCLEDRSFVESARERQTRYFERNPQVIDGNSASRIAGFISRLAQRSTDGTRRG